MFPLARGGAGRRRAACSTMVLAQGVVTLSLRWEPPRGAPHPAFSDVFPPALSPGPPDFTEACDDLDREHVKPNA